MMDVTRGPDGEVVIRIIGIFDNNAARRLAGWLVEVPQQDPVVLDMTHVRDCEDFGLAALAADLGGRDRLVVLGLTRHQERLLGYLGVSLVRAGPTPSPGGRAPSRPPEAPGELDAVS